MAQTNISADKTDGQVVQAEHVNELKNTIITEFVGRNAEGTPESGQDLGTVNYPWGVIRGESLVMDGDLIDFSTLTSLQNIVKSGKTRSTSDLADFIRASGSSNSATIQGASTNLVMAINGSVVTVDSDIVISPLTVASSGPNDTCVINDSSLSDQLSTKYLGDDDSHITVDNMGSSISAKIGSYVCLKRSTEYMLAYVESTTILSNIKRGFFFNSSGNPIVRETLANNDTLYLQSLGWVFIEDNATTFDVTYNSPIYSATQPSSPALGDYWFDLDAKLWKRYDGTVFEIINRILIGLVVMDTSNCVASRSVDFDLNYSDLNSIAFKTTPFSSNLVKSEESNNVISVNGNTLEIFNDKVTFNTSTDFDSGVTEAASTSYYMYITQDGESVISDEKPYSFDAKLQGQYHPYQSWRFVGSFYNNGSSNISSVLNVVKYISELEVREDLTVKGDSDLEGDATIGEVLTVEGNSYLEGDVAVSGTLTAQSSTTSVSGLSTIATQAEVDAGTNTSKYVTPSTLSNYPDLGGGLIGVQVFTNSGTWTKPSDCNRIIVEGVGGGGGGSSTGSAGGNGGTTSFGSEITCNGGAGGSSSQGGNGGASSGGFLNISGQRGDNGFTYRNGSGDSTRKGGDGGTTFLGFGGRGRHSDAAGLSSTGYGSGGAGGGIGHGGGAGGYSKKYLNSPSSSYSITIGSGGAGGTSGSNGSAGRNGVVIIYEYK